MQGFDQLVAQEIALSTAVEKTPRVMQMLGLFDVPPMDRSDVTLSVKMPLGDRPWNIGLICGPSGCGKTTIARKLFGDHIVESFEWHRSRSLIDGFPQSMGIKEIVLLLSSVGFSSPPSWVRPFHALSNGEQFRVTMARIIAEQRELAVIDEFTSVVGRTVAKVASCAIAKAVRSREQKLIAVTCHDDVEEWLQPDWVYLPATSEFQWRCLQRRPDVSLEIFRCDKAAWQLFGHHHYLDQTLSISSHCWVALADGVPAAFVAVLPMIGHGLSGRNAWRASRLVTLPDYQGIGLGGKVFDLVASIYVGAGFRFYATAGHPVQVRSMAASPKWTMLRKSKLGRASGRMHYQGKGRATKHAILRLTAGFRFCGPPLTPRARAVALLGQAAASTVRGGRDA